MKTIKKFIIAINDLEESTWYVSGSCFDNAIFSTTYNIKEAKMFDSMKAAKEVANNLKLSSSQTISYLEVYDLKKVSSADYLLGDEFDYLLEGVK